MSTEKTTTAPHAPSMLDAKHAVPNPDGSPNILRFGDGLMLWVTPRQKMWRGKVQHGGKSSTLNIGLLKDLTPKQAKAKFLALRETPDPAQARREAAAAAKRAATTFAVVAERWRSETSADERWTERHARLVQQRLAKHVLPAWGERPVGELGKDDVRILVRGVHERSGLAIGVAIKQYISSMFDYAVAFGMVAHNPAKAIARHLPKRKHGDETPNAHVRTIEDARAVLAAVEARRRPAQPVPGWRGAWVNPWTLLAHRLIALTGCRKNEVVAARWPEFDLDAEVWTIPATRMKGRMAHAVALAPQAIEVIQAARRIRAQGSAFVFPACGRGRKGRAHLADATVNSLMRRALADAGLGQVMVPHGWRHTFSTIMNEVDPGSFRVVDVMLAHRQFRDSAGGEVVKSSTEAKYNHARHESARHRIARAWADMLLPPGAPSALSLTGLEVPASNIVKLADFAGHHAA